MAAPCTAAIRHAADNGLAYARTAPGIGSAFLGYVPDGVGGYSVIEAKADTGGMIWVHLAFSGGASGWVSSDRIDILGDCSLVGFGILAQPKQASTIPFPVPVTPPVPVHPPVPTPPPPVPGDTLERVRKAAFNITLGFEGGAYDTYQNYDDGVVSYGRFGFTLAGGSLYIVLNNYLTAVSGAVTATSAAAAQLRSQYLQRVQNADTTLRYDQTFKALLLTVASDPLMHQAQDGVATQTYWLAMLDLTVKPRNLKLPLSEAFLFDLAVNSGVRNDLITSAEEALGVPMRSRVIDNGISEQQLVIQVAQIRHDRLYAIANQQNLPGLKPRADFWVSIMHSGDWNLQGDATGSVLIKSGRLIQVRNP